MVYGPKSPPQLATSRGIGWVNETPLATMAAKTRTLIAIRAIVIV